LDESRFPLAISEGLPRPKYRQIPNIPSSRLSNKALNGQTLRYQRDIKTEIFLYILQSISDERSPNIMSKIIELIFRDSSLRHIKMPAN